MKLCECTMGQLVVAKEDDKRIGHIVGLAYNYDLSILIHCKDMSSVEIIPVVQFVGEDHTTKIHYENINKFTKY
jgi:hypothetical protein